MNKLLIAFAAFTLLTGCPSPGTEFRAGGSVAGLNKNEQVELVDVVSGSTVIVRINQHSYDMINLVTSTITSVDFDVQILAQPTGQTCTVSNSAGTLVKGNSYADNINVLCAYDIPTAYDIGDTGPAGGIVFYIDSTGLHGLEAAPADQNVVGFGAEWGCKGIPIGASGMAIGTGAQNTTTIQAAECSPGYEGNSLASDLVSSYDLNGYSDWFLPSHDELAALYSAEAVVGVGGFAGGGYWSSSEVFLSTSSWALWSEYYPTRRDATNNVRAVRDF